MKKEVRLIGGQGNGKRILVDEDRNVILSVKGYYEPVPFHPYEFQYYRLEDCIVALKKEVD